MDEICEILQKSNKKDDLFAVINTVVLDSVELDKSKRIDEFDDDYDDDEITDSSKTEEEILLAIEYNANDALVIMAEQLFSVIHDLCLIHYDNLKSEGEIEVTE
jgi:hypothetical protein